MLDIEFVKKQLGLENEDPKILMRFLGTFEKFNDGCFSCGSHVNLLYTQMNEVLCENCRRDACIGEDGLIDDAELERVVAEVAASLEDEDDEDWEDFDLDNHLLDDEDNH